MDLDAAVDEVTGFTRYRIDGDPDDGRRDDRRARPGRHRDAAARPAPRPPDPARHEADRRGGARGVGDPGPQRRADRRDRARGEGRADGRAHAAAPRAAGPAPGRRRARACSPGTATATPRCAVRSPRPSPTFDDQRLAEIPVGRPAHRSRSTSSPTAGACDAGDTPTAWSGDRQRTSSSATVPARARAARRGSPSACSATPSVSTRSGSPRAGAAPRGALRREGSGDEGDGRRALEVRAARRRGDAAAERVSPRSRCTARPPELADERGRRTLAC